VAAGSSGAFHPFAVCPAAGVAPTPTAPVVADSDDVVVEGAGDGVATIGGYRVWA
jgi:hypothetical protein